MHRVVADALLVRGEWNRLLGHFAGDFMTYEYLLLTFKVGDLARARHAEPSPAVA